MKYKTKVKIIKLWDKTRKIRDFIIINILFIISIVTCHFIYVFIEKCYETCKNILVP